MSGEASTTIGHDVLGYAELCRPGAIDYLEKHRIPQLFRSLVAALMVEQPQDHVAFIKRTLVRAVELGVPSLNWETFVYGLHPKRSPQRLEYVRDGTPYEAQGLELMEQQRRLRSSGARPPAASPMPPPLSPAPSLAASSEGGGSGGAGELFRLTQLSPDPRPSSAASGGSHHRRLPAPNDDTQEYVSDEVDKLLSEAIVLSVAARGDSAGSAGSLVASLQAKLLTDAGRSDIAPEVNDSDGSGDGGGFGLFDSPRTPASAIADAGRGDIAPKDSDVAESDDGGGGGFGLFD